METAWGTKSQAPKIAIVAAPASLINRSMPGGIIVGIFDHHVFWGMDDHITSKLMIELDVEIFYDFTPHLRYKIQMKNQFYVGL